MRFWSIPFIIFPLSCGVAQARQTSEIAPQDVTYCQLAKDPVSFSGRRIRVRAIYRYMFEVQRLEPPACCPEYASKIKIWVSISADLEGRSERLFRRFPEGMGLVLATFVGKFESGGTYGTFADRHKLTVDEIEKLERTAKAPRHQDDPAWVPKNCEPSGATPAKESSSAILHEARHADGTARVPKVPMRRLTR